MTTQTTNSSKVRYMVEIDVNEIDDFDAMEEQIKKKKEEVANFLMTEGIKKKKEFWLRKLWWKILVLCGMGRRYLKSKLKRTLKAFPVRCFANETIEKKL